MLVAGAWGEADLTAAEGRLVVVMDVNWLDSSRQGPSADAFAEHRALLQAPAMSPVASGVGG